MLTFEEKLKRCGMAWPLRTRRGEKKPPCIFCKDQIKVGDRYYSGSDGFSAHHECVRVAKSERAARKRAVFTEGMRIRSIHHEARKKAGGKSVPLTPQHIIERVADGRWALKKRRINRKTLMCLHCKNFINRGEIVYSKSTQAIHTHCLEILKAGLTRGE